MPETDVRGYDAYSRKAPPSLRALAGVADLGFAAAAFALAIRSLRLSVAASPPWALAFAATAAALWVLQRGLAGRTLGQRAWKLMPSERGVLQPAARTAASVFGGILLTFAGLAAAGWVALQALDQDPLWLEAESVALDPFIPQSAGEQGDWAIQPFYYSLGAWPRTFNGNPVFHTLPYEKGPPTRFPGHIIARWEMPDTRLTFEGPKTPEGVGRRELERCLVSRELSFGCWSVRRAVLARHLDEMTESLGARAPHWELKWILVRNAALESEEQAQGFLLTATGDARFQSRFVLVTAKGTEQSFILDGANGPSGELARGLLDKAIRSLRASDDLNPGRAWVDREIENVKLGELNFTPAAAPEELARLAGIQALLLSKISVDPGTFDSYFHLGGTSWMLAQYALKHPQSGLGAVARPLVQSSYRYAQDVAPNDPRTQQLQSFWLEAQKF